MLQSRPALHPRALALSDAIRGITAPYVCSGSRRLDAPVSLRFRNNAALSVRPARGEHWQPSENAPLIERCSPPAPIPGRRPHREPSRASLALSASDGACAAEGLDLAALGVLEAVRSQLFPDDPGGLSATLRAVEVCNEQGSIRTRVAGGDGALLVCLPSLFSAGRLVITHRGAHEVFDWGWEIGKNPQTIWWAACVGDASYQVEPVLSGSRVALLFELHRGAGAVRAVAPDIGALLNRSLDDALDDPSFLPDGGAIAFPCLAPHDEDASFQREIGHLSAALASSLGGRDALVARAALARRLPVELRPYMIESSSDLRWELESFPSPTQRSRLGFRMNDTDLTLRLPVLRKLGHEDAPGVAWINEQPCFTWAPHFYGDDRDGNPIPADPDRPALRYLHACEYSPVGHGSDGVPTTLHLYSALLIAIPPAAERADRAPPAPLDEPAPAQKKAVRKIIPRAELPPEPAPPPEAPAEARQRRKPAPADEAPAPPARAARKSDSAPEPTEASAPRPSRTSRKLDAEDGRQPVTAGDAASPARKSEKATKADRPDKDAKGDPAGKVAKTEMAAKAAKAEKAEKTGKAGKTGKAEKTGKVAKTEKTEKAEKATKTGKTGKAEKAAGGAKADKGEKATAKKSPKAEEKAARTPKGEAKKARSWDWSF